MVGGGVAVAVAVVAVAGVAGVVGAAASGLLHPVSQVALILGPRTWKHAFCGSQPEVDI